MAFSVFIDDNFNYMDEDARYKLGDFDTLEEAIDTCKKIVDDFLLENYKPGMRAAELSSLYVNFGEDPFIIGQGTQGVLFSAWNYAGERCREICGEV